MTTTGNARSPSLARRVTGTISDDVAKMTAGQARREPQRGPGKHYRGSLSPPPHSVCLEIDTPKEETWGEVSTHHPNGGSGERRRLPKRGPGRSPRPKMDFMHILGKKTRKLCYRKDDRAMPPCDLCMDALKFSGLPDYAHCYYSQHFSWAFVPIDPTNVRKKFEVCSFTRS